jgi:hypothetical protein
MSENIDFHFLAILDMNEKIIYLLTQSSIITKHLIIILIK